MDHWNLTRAILALICGSAALSLTIAYALLQYGTPIVAESTVIGVLAGVTFALALWHGLKVRRHREW